MTVNGIHKREHAVADAHKGCFLSALHSWAKRKVKNDCCVLEHHADFHFS